MLALDVDGVLTDGMVYVRACPRRVKRFLLPWRWPRPEELSCEETKRFSVRDGHGIELAREAGLQIMLLTQEGRSDVLLARAKKLGLSKRDVWLGCGDGKRTILHVYGTMESGLEPHEVCFVGDDEFDVEVMEYAGFAACPADAHPSAKAAADYICENRGGHGAVREVIDMILACRR